MFQAVRVWLSGNGVKVLFENLLPVSAAIKYYITVTVRSKLPSTFLWHTRLLPPPPSFPPFFCFCFMIKDFENICELAIFNCLFFWQGFFFWQGGWGGGVAAQGQATWVHRHCSVTTSVKIWCHPYLELEAKLLNHWCLWWEITHSL